MNAVAAAEAAPHFWSEEPSKLPGRRRIRARIGGLHCSLCTGTIEKALGRLPGVEKVAVSLTHEQALIEYDPSVTHAEDLLQTLMDIGCTVSDPRKLRPYEEEERALVRERRRCLTALTTSIAAMGLVGYPVDSVWFPLCVFSIASLVALAFVVLRSYGMQWAVAGSTLLATFGAATYYFQLRGTFGAATPWVDALLAARSTRVRIATQRPSGCARVLPRDSRQSHVAWCRRRSARRDSHRIVRPVLGARDGSVLPSCGPGRILGSPCEGSTTRRLTASRNQGRVRVRIHLQPGDLSSPAPGSSDCLRGPRPALNTVCYSPSPLVWAADCRS